MTQEDVAVVSGNGWLALQPAPFRDDLRVPVVTVITETDLLDGHLLGYHRARRPDGDLLRAWELPGSSHADNYTIKVGFIDSGAAPIEQLAAAYAPTSELMGQQLSYVVNFAPQHRLRAAGRGRRAARLGARRHARTIGGDARIRRIGAGLRR